jgi:hypothetical protein
MRQHLKAAGTLRHVDVLGAVPDCVHTRDRFIPKGFGDFGEKFGAGHDATTLLLIVYGIVNFF